MLATTTSQLLADTGGWDHMTGWGWGWMTMGWVFWLPLIGLAVWGMSRFFAGSGRRQDAEKILEDRYARGEMSREEFEEHRDALKR